MSQESEDKREEDIDILLPKDPPALHSNTFTTSHTFSPGNHRTLRPKDLLPFVPHRPLQSFLQKIETLKLIQSKSILHDYNSPIRIRPSSPRPKRSLMSKRASLSIKNLTPNNYDTLAEMEPSLQFGTMGQTSYIVTNKSLPNSTYHSWKFSRLRKEAISTKEIIGSKHMLIRKNCTTSPSKVELEMKEESNGSRDARSRFVGALRLRKFTRVRVQECSPSKDKRTKSPSKSSTLMAASAHPNRET